MSMNRNHKLTTADLGKFSPFRVGPELLERADIRRVTDAEAHEEYGITGHGDRAGLVFPTTTP